MMGSCTIKGADRVIYSYKHYCIVISHMKAFPWYAIQGQLATNSIVEATALVAESLDHRVSMENNSCLQQQERNSSVDLKMPHLDKQAAELAYLARGGTRLTTTEVS